MSKYPRIAIIGAGPAGLVTANIFYRHGWPVSILESDESVESRDQGGMLDLHPDSGQLAMKGAGLFEKFMEIARHEDQETRIFDALSGDILFEENPKLGEGERPEIDRIELRKLLIEPLPPKTIIWNARVQKITTQADGSHMIELKDQNLGPFDLIIGADGAWSRTRLTALTDVSPIYSGVTFVELWLLDVEKRHPELAKLVGHGTLSALHRNEGIFAQRNGNDVIRVYAGITTGQSGISALDQTINEITIPEIMMHYQNWSPTLTKLITEANSIAAIRPINGLPLDFRWDHKSGITLIGDAAHLMPPMGEGVNLALLDAYELAFSVINTPDWRKGVKKFENTMMARSVPIMKETKNGFADWFSKGSVAVVKHIGNLQEEVA